jgi:hypothetical protein
MLVLMARAWREEKETEKRRVDEQVQEGVCSLRRLHAYVYVSQAARLSNSRTTEFASAARQTRLAEIRGL